MFKRISEEVIVKKLFKYELKIDYYRDLGLKAASLAEQYSNHDNTMVNKWINLNEFYLTKCMKLMDKRNKYLNKIKSKLETGK